MEPENSFGPWLKRRRRLDLTQQQLADCAGCSVVTVRKFEADERQPSRELVGLLADCLALAASERELFIAAARGLPTSPPPSPTASTLPRPATPFVGRSDELTHIAALLADPDCRLLTLVGPGGIGKTRLALTAAAAQTDRFADGVVFVPLAAVTQATQIPQAIAHSLSLSFNGPDTPAVQLGRYLQNRALLLVLDNFEQLLVGADLLADWLPQAPRTRWLLTSRERLNLVEEWLLPIQGFPEVEPGIELFAHNARRVQPQFDLASQAAAVADICRLVGGMPLAIELAAGWTAVMTCAQIADRIRHSFDFLSTSLRNVPQRHRSLRHLFDQTWQLLSSSQQAALQKLSVFRGGFTLDEAVAVAAADPLLLLTLTHKSLVLTDGSGRYDLHELTRQYAAAQLAEAGAEPAARRQHLQTFTTLVETAEPQLYGPNAIAWFKRLAAEQDNFRAALVLAVELQDGETALQLVNNLWWFWFRRGQWREAEGWLAATLDLTGPADTPARCRALLSRSTCVALQGRYNEAGPYLMEAIVSARRLEEGEVLVTALLIMGQALPDMAQALAAFAEAQSIWEQAGDPQRSWLLAYLHYLVGDRLRENGRYAEAADRYRQSLALYRQLGNVDSIAYPLGNLGRLALQDGRLAEAHALIGESLALSRAIGNRQGLADWLIPLGLVTLYLGDADGAAGYLQEAFLLHDEVGNQRGRAETLTGLALTALVQGSPDRARQYSRDSLIAYRENWQHSRAVHPALSDNQDHIVPDFVDAFLVAGLIEAAQGPLERAATLFAIAGRLQQQIGHQPIPSLQQQITTAEAAVRQKLAVAEYETACAVGQAWSLAEIFSFALT